jgi:hypothetical protein
VVAIGVVLCAACVVLVVLLALELEDGSVRRSTDDPPSPLVVASGKLQAAKSNKTNSTMFFIGFLHYCYALNIGGIVVLFGVYALL